MRHAYACASVCAVGSKTYALSGPHCTPSSVRITAQSTTEDAKNKQKSEENAMKKIARRFEAAKVAVLEQRGVTESLRFDPKLKAKGLLDLYMDKQPDAAVPDAKPKPAAGGE